jgi:predicted  nucleic acid-binding Zn-ribbon protein
MTNQIEQELEVKSRDGKTIVGKRISKTIEVYKEEGIRKIIKDLEIEISQLKKNLKEYKNKLLELQDVKETDDFKKYMEIINKGEIQELVPKLKEKSQLIMQISVLKKTIKQTKKDLVQIKKTVGSRFKV